MSIESLQLPGPPGRRWSASLHGVVDAAKGGPPPGRGGRQLSGQPLDAVMLPTFR